MTFLVCPNLRAHDGSVLKGIYCDVKNYFSKKLNGLFTSGNLLLYWHISATQIIRMRGIIGVDGRPLLIWARL